MPDAPRKNEKYTAMRSASLLLAIPTLLIVSPIVGFFLGNWLDHRIRTEPWLGIVGLMLGFAAGGRETYRIYQRYLEEKERAKRK